MLNKNGILQLAEDLVYNASRYNQNSLAKEDPACGTVCCLAGMCKAREIGVTEFNKLAFQKWTQGNEDSSFFDDCIDSAEKQLGILYDKNVMEEDEFTMSGVRWDDIDYPLIFETIYAWPEDLVDEYRSASTAKERVIVALKALQRLLPDGSIDLNPKKVHTRIPLLKTLREDVKKRGTI